ncbi:choice-of-anchor Q domain-containing protein [Dolichospermum sp. UHCC 0259]|uniref:choice-of-anchor Q domain-containing protein n=1 Tax=Dolichospermum sp. UHCC 0259 TaxID=2590010 RepID=UPI0020C3830F|nr:choice-of-anchor Q domain-containing protein [Dolichospermum sp. UHCC 0259]
MNTVLTLTYNQLSTFAGSDNFWNLFDTTFGTQYNRSAAEILRLQWLSGDFSQLPQIEILDNSNLGNANGAYAGSTNKIYLSDSFLANATPEAISAVLLEEIGHFIDAQINQIDTPGDEGEKFSALVRGQNLTTQELDRINTENDSANITVGGEQVAVEQNTPIVLTVTTTADQNDGSATGGLSLRDAILIANANTTNNYIINLTGGTIYKLTAFSLADTTGGDLDVLGKVTIQSTGTQPATIDASGLTNADRVFEVSNYLNLSNIVVTGGSTNDGGGIYINPNAIALLFNTTVRNNYSSYQGGGIYNDGVLTLVNSTVADNKVDGFYHGGGGIYNGGQAILLGTTIKNNTADSGGGIQSSGTLTISNSTIYNNTSQGFGGGIYHSGTTSLINSTVSGNQADYSGGIYASDGILNIFNSTITQNAADETYSFYVGGIDNRRASFNLKNSIVAGNIGGSPDLEGNINGNNNNLIGNLSGASGTVGTGTDIVNVNPKLGPLQDNGNGIFTHALLSGSPAINKGNNALVLTDVFDIDFDGNNTETIPFDNRGSGHTRISGGTVDIGAFEFQPAPVFTPIESAGNTKLVKDSTNKYFTQIGTNTPTAIKNGGQQIYQDIYTGWQTIAAETVNGDNQVLWKNISGNYLHIWHLDNNWNWVSSEGQWALNSVDALTQETNFGIDTNGDGVIGNPYTAIESAGNTKLVKDPTNKYFTQIGTNTPNTIKNGGQQIYQDIYSGWQTLA